MAFRCSMFSCRSFNFLACRRLAVIAICISTTVACRAAPPPTATLPASATAPADPPSADYQGYGAQTRGAMSSPDGWTTYHVRSLADRGAGTLRDGLAQGKRHVVFDVAGVINLERGLYINESYLTIDGASAPPPGVTIRRLPGVTFGIEPPKRRAISDIVIHHLRFDRGGKPLPGPHEGDVLSIDGEAGEVSNVIFDHLSVHQADDGVFDIRSNVHEVTVSWCLMTDTLVCTAISGNPRLPRRNISFHHNVWANNTERLPLIRANVQCFDMVNNIIYQWETAERGMGATRIAIDEGATPSSVNIVNNCYYPGPGRGDRAIVYGQHPGPEDDDGPSDRVAQGAIWQSRRMGLVYVAGNILPAANRDHWSTTAQPHFPPPWARVTAWPADELADRILPHVGTNHRTAAEQALIQTMRAHLATLTK